VPAEDAAKILPATEGELESRASQLAELLKNDRETAVFIGREILSFYAHLPEELAERLAMFGIRRVYVSYDREFFTGSGYRNMLFEVVSALHAKDMQVCIAVNMSDNMWHRSGNVLWRTFIDPRHDELDTVAEEIVDYQRKCVKKERPGAMFDGYMLIFNVESLTAGASDTPTGEIYGWGEQSYGKGQDNDMIIQKAFAMLPHFHEKFEQAKADHPEELGRMELSSAVAAPVYIVEKAEAGELSVGTLEDFRAAADVVYFDPCEGTSGNMAKRLAPLLEKSEKDKVGLWMPLSRHAETGQPALRRRSFKQFAVGLESVNSKCAANAGYRGVLFDEFAALQDIWEK